MSQFLGSKKINKTTEDNGFITVIFKDASSIVLKKNLFDIVVSDKERPEEILDIVRHLFTCKFLKEMSEYGLDLNTCAHISRGMETLAKNAVNEAVAKKFNVSNTELIKLSDIYEFIN